MPVQHMVWMQFDESLGEERVQMHLDALVALKVYAEHPAHLAAAGPMKDDASKLMAMDLEG